VQDIATHKANWKQKTKLIMEMWLDNTQEDSADRGSCQPEAQNRLHDRQI